MTCNSCVTSCMTFSFHSFIFSFSAWSSWVANCLMTAYADFPALVAARDFNRFVAFPLVALRKSRLPTPLTSDSIPTHCIIYPLWLDTSCSCPFGTAIVADASDLLLLHYPPFLHRCAAWNDMNSGYKWYIGRASHRASLHDQKSFSFFLVSVCIDITERLYIDVKQDLKKNLIGLKNEEVKVGGAE